MVLTLAVVGMPNASAAEVPDLEDEVSCLLITVGELQKHPASGLTRVWAEWTGTCCNVQSLVLLTPWADPDGMYHYWYQNWAGSTHRVLCDL
jgi:hypothetical protein